MAFEVCGSGGGPSSQPTTSSFDPPADKFTSSIQMGNLPWRIYLTWSYFLFSSFVSFCVCFFLRRVQYTLTNRLNNGCLLARLCLLSSFLYILSLLRDFVHFPIFSLFVVMYAVDFFLFWSSFCFIRQRS